jgi:hypothetical protein
MTTDLMTMSAFQGEDIWTSTLIPYRYAPTSAFSLAQILYSLREDIRQGNAERALAVLTDGIDKLFPFSEQYKTSHSDYWQAVKGEFYRGTSRL